MSELLIFLFATIGMAHVLVDGTIFNSFKNFLSNGSGNHIIDWVANLPPNQWIRSKLLELMNCYQCSGFWSGLIIGLIMWLNTCDPLMTPSNWIYFPVLFVYACVGSYVSTKAAVVIMWIQANSNSNN